MVMQVQSGLSENKNSMHAMVRVKPPELLPPRPAVTLTSRLSKRKVTPADAMAAALLQVVCVFDLPWTRISYVRMCCVICSCAEVHK